MKRIFLFYILISKSISFSQILPDTTCNSHIVSILTMPECNSNEYELIFEDNFDDNTLNLDNWTPKTGVPRDYEFKQQKAWHTPQNIEVSNGTLKIIGKKLETPLTESWVTNWDTNPYTTSTSTFDYTSGEIWTKRTFYYGKYETRCRIPSGKGLWPAFWVFNGPIWDEIDFFEIYGDNTDRYTCNVLHEFDGDEGAEACPFSQDNLIDFTNWHTFTCIFDFDKIVFLIDDVPIRTLHRFTDLTYNPIQCGDDIIPGPYLEKISYPLKSMHIILNLAIQSKDDAPDSSTVFPASFEVDYVRFYNKKDPNCDGCMSELNFTETTSLPNINMTKDLITASSNVKVENNQDVTFKSNKIILNNGFSALNGSRFLAQVENCTEFNYVINPIKFNHNAIDNYSILKCVNPIYTIDLYGVLYYEIRIIIDATDQLLVALEGEPSSNKIDIWNFINTADGWYRVELKLINCNDVDVKNYGIFVLSNGCKSGEINSVIENQFVEESIIEEFNMYPNPSSEILKIDYISFENLNALVEIEIKDNNGKHLKSSKFETKNGLNNFELDVNEFENGIYFIHFKIHDKLYIKKLIILHL